MSNSPVVVPVKEKSIFSRILSCISHETDIELVPWLKVCGKPWGLIKAGLLLLSVMLLAIMLYHNLNYIRLVLERPKIVCTPRVFPLWRFFVPLLLLYLFVFPIFTLFLTSRTRYISSRSMCMSKLVFILSLIMFLFCALFSPLFDKSDTMISDDNSSIILYQYGFEDNQEQAYILLLYPEGTNSTDTNVTDVNLTCTYTHMADLCSSSGSILRGGYNGAFKCRPGLQEPLQFFSPEFDSISHYAHSGMSLAFAFGFFYALLFFLTYLRRLHPCYTCIEERICGYATFSFKRRRSYYMEIQTE